MTYDQIIQLLTPQVLKIWSIISVLTAIGVFAVEIRNGSYTPNELFWSLVLSIVAGIIFPIGINLILAEQISNIWYQFKFRRKSH